MRKMIFAGIFALSASTSLAQTNTAPETTNPAPEGTAPEMTAPAEPTAANAGGPANLCQELLAFMEAPPPEEVAPAAPAKPAAEPAEQQAAPAQDEAAPAQQEAAGQQEEAPAEGDSSALAGTTQAGEGATAKPENEADSAQEVTGQDGVATDAPEPDDEQTAAGSVANAPQKESRPAPLPAADVSSTPKESVMTVEEAEQLATTNDMAACHDMARQMRVAGVSMPPPLIALAALDLQYHQAGAAASSQAPQTQEPEAPATQEPAAQPEQ